MKSMAGAEGDHPARAASRRSMDAVSRGAKDECWRCSRRTPCADRSARRSSTEGNGSSRARRAGRVLGRSTANASGIEFSIRDSFATGDEVANIRHDPPRSCPVPSASTQACSSNRVGPDGLIRSLRAFWEFDRACHPAPDLAAGPSAAPTVLCAENTQTPPVGRGVLRAPVGGRVRPVSHTACRTARDATGRAAGARRTNLATLTGRAARRRAGPRGWCCSPARPASARRRSSASSRPLRWRCRRAGVGGLVRAADVTPAAGTAAGRAARAGPAGRPDVRQGARRGARRRSCSTAWCASWRPGRGAACSSSRTCTGGRGHLDLIRFLARRLVTAPALLVVTIATARSAAPTRSRSCSATWRRLPGSPASGWPG